MWRRTVSRVNRFIKDMVEVSPPEERPLFTFKAVEELSQWEVFSDSMMGGSSSAKFLHCSKSGVAVFSGDLSDVKKDALPGQRILRRSGFCGIRSLPRSMWEEEPFIDLEPYNVLGFRIKGDGRPYLASIRTDNWAAPPGSPPDLWQAFLFAPAGEWATVEIPINRFLLTWRGRVIEQPKEMSTSRVISLGISLALGKKLQKPGSFQLEIKGIHAAQRDLPPEECARKF
mmetsp:Transcript_13758/g.26394  ORF Transcript_13758/g.26394 Transcript_13758/m.26394 type:complete len:229 (-) Transcript_13758:531-1217(-)|eukprot:CAMPEP_0114253482 /NCGR_PEP_ID=MMETSP0058-20121206/16419_1 /TAXON_ID=36894 /ORGANISM="Pyramimonas parkeae, CCMP726" /LENGTH=228 /DNA_ID=CAMNT_0001367537 /DNA_START=105 /DNA_END=791 /DNA_ORIENTATION=+